jgi:hypothetical protein
VGDPRGDADGSPYRDIGQLAGLVGRYCWLEHRLFGLTGTAASAPAVVPGDPGEAECRVWFAAASRRHGALAAGWTEHLPVRVGVDRDALVVEPPGPLPGLLDDLATTAAAEPARGLAGLLEGVLPALAATYGLHLQAASPVSEGPVMEGLVEARRVVLGELRGGVALLGSLPGGARGNGQPGWPGGAEISEIVERAFEGFGVFPAVRPS